MIYFDETEDNTLNSIVEGIYLSEKFSDRIGNSDIIVCPYNIKYIINKTIIINRSDYPRSNIQKLLDNGCNIISRVDLGNLTDCVDFQPYIIRPDFGVMWNGMVVDVSGLTELYEILQSLEDRIIFNPEKDLVLYFPKLTGLDKKFILDDNSNLTALGWLMHQVGINTKESDFLDIDLLKTKKLLI